MVYLQTGLCVLHGEIAGLHRFLDGHVDSLCVSRGDDVEEQMLLTGICKKKELEEGSSSLQCSDG